MPKYIETNNYYFIIKTDTRTNTLLYNYMEIQKATIKELMRYRKASHLFNEDEGHYFWEEAASSGSRYPATDLADIIEKYANDEDYDLVGFDEYIDNGNELDLPQSIIDKYYGKSGSGLQYDIEEI